MIHHEFCVFQMEPLQTTQGVWFIPLEPQKSAQKGSFLGGQKMEKFSRQNFKMALDLELFQNSWESSCHHVIIIISVILITGGHGTGTSVEVVSRWGSPLPCTVPPLPAYRSYHTQDGEVACGGDNTATLTSCVTLTASGWTTSHHLVEERHNHVSWRSPAGLLLMGGEYTRRSTELLSNTNSSSSPSFNLEYDLV